MFSLIIFVTVLISIAYGTTTTELTVGFYNTGQSLNMLASINDISGNNPPSQQTAQIDELLRQSNELDLEVLCLSDLHLSKQLEQYRTALKDKYPYSWSQLDVKPESDFITPRTACSAMDFVNFQSGDTKCTQDALKKCDEVLRETGSNILDFKVCLAKECPLNYEKILYSECESCMTIFTEANNWDKDVAGQALGLAVWGCGMEQDRVMNFTDGTLILSKYEIKEKLSVPIPSFIFSEQRLNVISIEVNGNDVYVGCTDMNPTTYKDNVDSYVAVTEQQRKEGIKNHIELNAIQIERIVDLIDDVINDRSDDKSKDEYNDDITLKRDDDDKEEEDEEVTVILMGDMGIGQTWHEENFGLLTFAGYENYGGGECTFCVNKEKEGIFYNPLAVKQGDENNLFDSSISKDLDHILVRDDANKFTVNAWSRFMTEKTYKNENNDELVPYSPRWGLVMALQLNGNDNNDDKKKENGNNKEEK